MDALSILALGVASSAGGGGGGTPNWDDVTDKPFESVGSGLSVDSEGILSATQELPTITGNAGKVLIVNSGATDVEWSDESSELPSITGNASKVLKVNSGATAVEWANESTELPTIESGDAGKVLKVNSGETGVEWSAAGGSDGAVRYDEAQSLTDSQKNQAKDNQGLPYMTTTRTAGYENWSTSDGWSTGSQMVYLYKTFSNVGPNSLVFHVVGVNNGHTVSATLTRSSLNTTICTITPDDEYSATYFNTNKVNLGSDYSYFSFSKKNTTDFGFTSYGTWSLYGDVLTPNNKLAEKLVDSDFLQNAIYDFNLNSARGWLVCQPSTSSYKIEGKQNLVAGSGNSVASNTIGAIIVGSQHRTINNTSPYALIGNGNQSGTGNTSNSNAPNTKAVLIGEQLIVSQSNNSTVIGRYNASTSKYSKYNGTTTYNAGDCVTADKTNTAAAVWRCKADGTLNKAIPSSGTTGNDYWDYVDDGTSSAYLFVIGNGTANATRSNALTVDTAGNLVCNNIPAPPSSDGNYVLQCSVSSGVVTYSWVAQS